LSGVTAPETVFHLDLALIPICMPLSTLYHGVSIFSSEFVTLPMWCLDPPCQSSIEIDAPYAAHYYFLRNSDRFHPFSPHRPPAYINCALHQTYHPHQLYFSFLSISLSLLVAFSCPHRVNYAPHSHQPALSRLWSRHYPVVQPVPECLVLFARTPPFRSSCLLCHVIYAPLSHSLV